MDIDVEKLTRLIETEKEALNRGFNEGRVCIGANEGGMEVHIVVTQNDDDLFNDDRNHCIKGF